MGAVAGARKTGRGRASGYTPPIDVQRIGTADFFDPKFHEKVPVLFGAGNRSLLSLPSVAIVGSRKTSAEGRKRAHQLARDLFRRDIVVMSGLAEGIDEAAHVAALELGGRTIAVIGTPLERAYPASHAELQERIYREHLLLSPFEPGTPTYPGSFPVRNRVMARLALATVVIEAGDTSGSLHQVIESVKVGRPVFIARSIVDDPTLSWPARFLPEKVVHILESSSQVIHSALGGLDGEGPDTGGVAGHLLRQQSPEAR